MTEYQGRLEKNYSKNNFGNVTKEHEKIVVRQFLNCYSGGCQLEDFLEEIVSCSFVAARRCPDGPLLQFTLPFGNGR